MFTLNQTVRLRLEVRFSLVGDAIRRNGEIFDSDPGLLIFRGALSGYGIRVIQSVSAVRVFDSIAVLYFVFRYTATTDHRADAIERRHVARGPFRSQKPS